MKIVAVTSCITGIAHTYMAAEALEQAAKRAGHEITVETQGSAGSTPMPQAAIDGAELCIFATDLDVKDLARFNGKAFIHAGVTRAISDADSVVAEAVAAAVAGSLGHVSAPATVQAPVAAAKPGFFARLFGKRS